MRRRKNARPASSEWAFMGAVEVVRGFVWLARLAVALGVAVVALLGVVAWLALR